MNQQPSLAQLSEQLVKLLDQAIQEFSSIPVRGDGEFCPTGLSVELTAERLALELPLKVAIVGRFSSGKSTMLNALLGEDLVPTDVNVSTATVNCFCYGEEKELEVHWQNGHVTKEPYDMLSEYAQHKEDSEETQTEIDHVDVYTPYPSLKQVMIIDTPGLDVLIGHHVETTKRMLRHVDAVVYLFNGVPREEDKGMLVELLREHRSKTLGVLAKVDMLTPEEQRRIIAHAMHFLKDTVSEIVPISAQMALAAELLDEEQFRQLKHISDSLDDDDWEDITFDDTAFQEDVPDILEDVTSETCRDLSKRLTIQGIRKLRSLFSEAQSNDVSVTIDQCRELLIEESQFPQLEVLLHERVFKQRDHIKVYQVARRVAAIFQRHHQEMERWRLKEEERIQLLESRYQMVTLKAQRQKYMPELVEMTSALNDLIPLVSEILCQKRDEISAITRSMGDYPQQIQLLMAQLDQIQSRFWVVQKVYETRRLNPDQKTEALRIMGESASSLTARLGLSDEADADECQTQFRNLRRRWALLSNQGFSRDEREIGDAIINTLNALSSGRGNPNELPIECSHRL